MDTVSHYVDEVRHAAETIAPFAIETPLIRSEPLSELTGGDVYLKLESLQRTGSFKVRGAAHRMVMLTASERDRGVVACSSGNHGRAVAYVANALGVEATICVPRWVDRVKLEAMRQSGAHVDTVAVDYDDAERRAADLVHTRDKILIHPFDDRHILAGQGTIALEILADDSGFDVIAAPLSGGGLVAGIALGVRARAAACRVLAVTATNANAMAASLAAGRPITVREDATIANALSGGIGLDNKHTFQLVRSLVDAHATVTESDIMLAMRLLCDQHRLVVEGGGAAAVAAVLAEPASFRNKRVAVVVSGGNIDLTQWIDLVLSR